MINCINCNRLHELLTCKDRKIFDLEHKTEQQSLLIGELDRQRDERNTFPFEELKEAEAGDKFLLEKIPDGWRWKKQ